MSVVTDRYIRQVVLPEVGEVGQQRLHNGRVLVVGAGGLGCPVLQYLAAAGVGTLGIIDSDVVERSNLHRQILFRDADLGEPKAVIAAQRILELNPQVRVNPVVERFSPANAAALCAEYDLVIDGSDNFPTRYLVNDACVVTKRPFIGASIQRFHGQVGVFHVETAPSVRSATYRCLFPEPPDPRTAPTCSAMGVIGAVPGIFGALQAEQAIELLLGRIPGLTGKLLQLDLLSGRSAVVSISLDAAAVSSTKIRAAEEYQTMCRGVDVEEPVVREITPRELQKLQSEGGSVTLIDVREEFERQICSLGGLHIPMQAIPQRFADVPRDHPVVVYCRSGARSEQVIDYLQRDHGFANLRNLAGGILRWSDEVDSRVRKY